MSPRSRDSLQRRIEREEFARGHLPAGATPVVPRPAATSVLARPRGDGGRFEVLLLERPDTARFAAGAFVFPGGVVDPGDAADVWSSRLPAVHDAERAPLAAALRELFEETGVLLSASSPHPHRLADARAALLRGEREFGELAAELGLDFSDARVAYFARWITPERFARRYDTRFFFALVPPEVEVGLTDEHVSTVWMTPRSALAGFRAGELPMLFPTWKTLERLSVTGSLEETMRLLAAAEVETLIPRLEVRGGDIRPVMPDGSP